jgi:hypothetical protein
MKLADAFVCLYADLLSNRLGKRVILGLNEVTEINRFVRNEVDPEQYARDKDQLKIERAALDDLTEQENTALQEMIDANLRRD